MTDSVQVAVRVRPLVPSELSKGCKEVLEVHHEISQVRITDSDRGFSYNYVYGVETHHDIVYTTAVKPLIEKMFSGYNITVLAYGQTGSGKTYSMGTNYCGSGDKGVIPQAIEEVFAVIKDNFSFDCTLTVSFMELYQEVLYDLFSEKSREQCILEIREDTTKGIIIPGLVEVPVSSEAELFATLIKGSTRRATGSTNMNAQSSRSHAIFTVNLTMNSKTNSNENRTSKLNFVDLAGSERPKKTGAVGNTFKEGVNINKGLLVLGNVISALGDEKQNNFIPYRDSNLTRLLKDSLGGNSITLMIACVSPADYNLEETMSTLRYADRARRIRNKPIVNQDPKAAEINNLRKTIQRLQLQIVGQGGPSICPGEIELLKKENMDLRIKIRELTLQLSSTLHSNTGLLETIVILQNSNEQLHCKIERLKDDYNLTINNLSIGLENNDNDAVKVQLNKLQDIKEHLFEIGVQHKKTETEILNHELSLDHNSSKSGDPEISQDQEKFTTQQMALSNELQGITKELRMKEELAKQISANNQYMIDYKELAENEEKIVTLQKEKDELLHQLKNIQTSGASGKVAEQRRKRVKDLEVQIQDLNKKLQEQARLIKLKEKDELKMRKLNNEILQMKQTKVRLIKKMREEIDTFRNWKVQKERELAKVKNLERKKANQIVRMEAMHSKQQNVLKRKVEEAVALNKRLKDALALRKTVQGNKNLGKSERIAHLVKQEVEFYTNVIEAKATLDVLLDDRATLQGQLTEMKENPDVSKIELQAIEEDIELRSVQIQGLQQKILDSDEDSKSSKCRFENIQVMGDAKLALNTMLEQTGQMKKTEIDLQTKLDEAQTNQNELHGKVNKLECDIKRIESKHAGELDEVQRTYEEKIGVLLRQLRGIKVENADEELRKRIDIEKSRNDTLESSNLELLTKISDFQKQSEALKGKLDMVGKLAQKAESLEEFLTPVKVPSRRNKSTVVPNTTFVLDSSTEFEDDPSTDPDWTRTPIGKFILRNKKNGESLAEISNIVGSKRTSEGGCACTTNCSKRCGCVKLKKSCASGCKCRASLCTNHSSSDESSESAEKRMRLEIPALD